MTRDFVGYGPTPPHANLAGEARIAVNFVINFEEGSELSYPAGDGVSEGGLTEAASIDPGWPDGAISAPKACSNTAAGSAGGGSIASSPIPGAGDAVRLRQGDRGEPAGGRGDRRQRLGHLRPRLSLDQAFRIGRGRGAPARSRPPSRSSARRPASRRWAGTAAIRRRRTRAGSSPSMAAFSTTATPITTNCRIGCGWKRSRTSSCRTRCRPTM